jgi:hypothetical protein
MYRKAGWLKAALVLAALYVSTACTKAGVTEPVRTENVGGRSDSAAKAFVGALPV